MRIQQATSIVALLLAAACAHEPKTVSPQQEANANCISGYFEGTATSEGSPDTLGLNLVCHGSAYEGDALTAVGRFRVLGANRQDGQLEINIGEDQPLGTLLGTLDGTRIVGRFRYGDEAGTFDVRRVGPARPPPHLNLSTEAWREDVDFFSQELPRRHGNAFHTLSRERFNSEISAIVRDLPGLDGDGVFVRLMRVANLVGDGHTGLVFPKDRPVFPLELRRFGEDYRVVAARPGTERVLGTRLVTIDGRPIAEVRELLWSLTPAEETPQLRELRIDAYMSNGLLLHGIHVIADRNVAGFGFIDERGNPFTQILQVGPSSEHSTWARIPKSPPLSDQRPNVPFWFTYLPEAKTTYVSFRGYDGLERNARALFASLEHDRPEKLVIDLRHNGGGDNTQGLQYVVEPLRRVDRINKMGHLYVLIGVATFSAAMNNAAHFRERTAAILVGEPIGERPNSYQEPREVKLPNSGLILRTSTQYYAFVHDDENVIRPDRTIVPTWSEFEEGRDRVMEWLLSRRPNGDLG
jgi:hypothetical protein